MSDRTKTAKHPYHPPQLKMYGDIKTLTQALSISDLTADNQADTNNPINKTF